MKNRRFFLGFLSLTLTIASLKAQENLIPMPQSMQVQDQSLDLNRGIVLDRSLSRFPFEAQLAQQIFKDQQISLGKGTKLPHLKVLSLDKNLGAEAYRLHIGDKGIEIQAGSSAGVFYALQSLSQMEFTEKKLAFLSIEDQPAFPWRGFLVDVGRNYQPLDMLKEQIEVMAKYKLNIFHFHFTEDIAWRLASKKYPGLTAASNMTRWPGQFYTEAEMKELIAFCKERHITLIPEIDMPGHSEAFKRFFGVDMQSEQGMAYIKELLQEFRETYPELKYLHIGGDEVKITNKDFMPEITRYVERLGYQKTIGWSPGSNLLPHTVRQLWMGGPEVVNTDSEFVKIDSKHLYINHMDPLETVTTLFYRKFGLQDQANEKLPGAVLCSWPDRAVETPRDMFYQNAVYPGIVTFGERAWKGGGEAHWYANIAAPGTPQNQAFHEFENRLLTHKERYFSNLPFPYTRQSGEVWELVGPFQNGGNTAKSFEIEKDPFGTEFQTAQQAEGGTLVLRHWWADVVQGALENPEENTTWYARRKIWSDTDRTGQFWIGFDNFSRSYASDSPEAGTWNYYGGQVWVNGQEVSPPHWAQAGMKGNLEKPLKDEGYSFRAPSEIQLKKGWNTVLVKSPMSSFRGKDWQNPAKWLFTFTEIKD